MHTVIIRDNYFKIPLTSRPISGQSEGKPIVAKVVYFASGVLSSMSSTGTGTALTLMYPWRVMNQEVC